ncbi:uncharacterized protein GGS22DRAFT_169343 [Annulohypoxylon maeteangense]|uniref:uncharacterized protein n=1 Tax=Annulohypoxylon maeteangense TaxID=1927788 RepID=UPI002007A0BC|nr:uncharacterized protein GGS22DRAFT_169343 [Annulohypoxylon maeteangense]KAI0882419.1 hypothetical protein GGS22DRAFT_169343 [Annulohypoxylon maeteangense]
MNSNSPADIPGYFWDPITRRYFKVQKRQYSSRDDAPNDEPWSLESVKRRKLDEEVAAEKARMEARNMSRITRSKALDEPLMGGFLAREYGHDVRDLQAAGFAQGLVMQCKVNTGQVYGQLSAMLICGKKDRLSLYSVLRRQLRTNDYPLGRDDRTGRIEISQSNHQTTVFPEPDVLISDIKCNRSMTYAFVSAISVTNGFPAFWKIPLNPRSTSFNTIDLPIPIHRRKLSVSPNTICVSPTGQAFQCLVGTDFGLASLDAMDEMNLIVPTKRKVAGRTYPESFADIFGVDYRVADPNVVFFGGRPGRLLIGDLRQDSYEWSSIQLPSSIAHVKAINDNQVLVAGLKNMMSVYDIRFCDRVGVNNNTITQNQKSGNPIVTMQEYRNPSRFTGGFDFDRGTGVAAAAHDDGKISLYSVRSGRRLPSRDIDKIHCGYGQIPCLQFLTLEGDHTPTLFVGEGTDVVAYSFGVDNIDDEC